MASRKIKRRPGRPKGSKTAPPLVVVEVPAKCPRCGSVEREVEHTISDRPISGSDSLGRPFTHVIHKRVRCTNCSQRYTLLRRE
jgi:hypothetical protein